MKQLASCSKAVIEALRGLDADQDNKYLSDKLYSPPKNSIRNAIYDAAKM